MLPTRSDCLHHPAKVASFGRCGDWQLALCISCVMMRRRWRLEEEEEDDEDGWLKDLLKKESRREGGDVDCPLPLQNELAITGLWVGKARVDFRTTETFSYCGIFVFPLQPAAGGKRSLISDYTTISSSIEQEIPWFLAALNHD